MNSTIHIDGQQTKVQSGLVSVANLYEIADFCGDSLFLSREDGIDIPLLRGEYLLIHGGEKFVTGEILIENNPPLRIGVNPEFNGSRDLVLQKSKIKGREFKERDDKFPDGRLFADIDGGVDAEILDEMMIVVQDSDSYFVIPSAPDNVIDLEECGKHDRRPPKGHNYRIRIDGDKYTVDNADITGTDILALARKRADEWSLNQKTHGGRRVKIEANEVVCLHHPGIERFETVRKQAQQGYVSEEYELPPEDVQYLNANYPGRWKKVTEGNGKFGLIIHDFPIPKGYIIHESILLVLIPSGYPGTMLDMFYFDPPLEKSDHSDIGTLVSERHFDKTWQRWSRHYEWNPGEDSIFSHIEYVKNQLEYEVRGCEQLS